ncbi:hypothetical protein HPB48_023239 [Haemaphysalis longicornis]|uniref:Uncharacterized protein n=1 Tax=Haemaphysalis longicornis TaxID=44386 RepID=A0A9J6H5T9_HAELO|nr:hypothetical protein HPB48_023239 [Haemaphysalis longicornis]
MELPFSEVQCRRAWELFRTTGQPLALLLQETRGTTPEIAGYQGYFVPSIHHKQRGGQFKTEAQAAIFIRKDIPHTQVDTSSYCTEIQETVAVRCTINKTRYLLASHYARPTTNYRATPGIDYSWLPNLRQQYPHDKLLFVGDFQR